MEAGRELRVPTETWWSVDAPAILRDALADEALRSRATDDASLVEAAGTAVFMVPGSSDNMKVTRPGDLPTAELLLAGRREEENTDHE